MSVLENCMHVDVKAPGCPATRRATGPSGAAWCRAGAARILASYSVGQNGSKQPSRSLEL